MSVTELAGALGVEQWWVEELEAGRCDPPLDVLRAVAGGLGVKLLVLFEEMIACSQEGRVRL